MPKRSNSKFSKQSAVSPDVKNLSLCCEEVKEVAPPASPERFLQSLKDELGLMQVPVRQDPIGNFDEILKMLTGSVTATLTGIGASAVAAMVSNPEIESVGPIRSELRFPVGSSPFPPSLQNSMSPKSSGTDSPRMRRDSPIPFNERRKQRLCQHPDGCSRYAQGNTRLCITHGGGRRCHHHGCTKSVQGAQGQFCIAHGGGRRCQVPGCTRSSRGNSDRCVHHGGGVRCHFEGCNKSAQRPSDYCIAHGGGKRCSVHGCGNSSRTTNPHLCVKHAKEGVMGIGGVLSYLTVPESPTIQHDPALFLNDGMLPASRVAIPNIL